MNNLPLAEDITPVRVNEQRLCAVYQADKLYDENHTKSADIDCGKMSCGVIAKLCVDGTISITNDYCSALSKEPSSSVQF